MGTSFFQQAKQIAKSVAMIISWTLFTILILIIGFLVYYLVCTNIYATKGEKFEPKFSLYTIVSPSMEPNINVYDVILNTRIDNPKDIKVGDVITFISTSNISYGMTVTHRVTSIIEGPDGLEFKTKGDNNLSEDSDTAKEKNLLGKVAIKIPQLGRLQFFLSTSGGWLLVIIFPALLIIVNDIFKIIKLNKAKKALDTAENNEIDEDKIKLETFRKNEIKDRLNKKELKKAKELENKLKSKKEVSNDENPIFIPAMEINNNVENDNENIENNDSAIPEISKNNIEIDNNNEENIIETEDLQETKEIIFDQIEENQIPNEVEQNIINNEETNIFGEPLEEKNIFSDENEGINDIIIENNEIETKEEIFETENEEEKEEISEIKETSKEDEENSITKEDQPNDFIGFELPKLKDEK